jgi:hypothetical protein
MAARHTVGSRCDEVSVSLSPRKECQNASQHRVLRHRLEDNLSVRWRLQGDRIARHPV